jgi:hypothetical protein
MSSNNTARPTESETTTALINNSLKQSVPTFGVTSKRDQLEKDYKTNIASSARSQSKLIRHSFHIPAMRFARRNGFHWETCVDPCSSHVRRLVNTACTVPLLTFRLQYVQFNSSGFVTRLLQHFRHNNEH